MRNRSACALLLAFALLSHAAYAAERSTGTSVEAPPAASAGDADRAPSDKGEAMPEGARAPEAEAPAKEAPDESVAINFPQRKDPFVAGLLSWFMMGVGQIYCREYTKGSLFIAADLLDKASLILLISHINNKYSPESGSEIILKWSSFEDGTKILILAYLAASLGMRFYSVADAIRSANDYNERLFSKRERSSMSFSHDGERLSLRYSLPLRDR